MTDEFKMTPGTAADAMERIIEGLTEAQQMVMVGALKQSKRKDVVTISSANERTVGSLMRGNAPLVRENRVSRRVMTPLGMDVARYLAETRRFDLLDAGLLVSGVLPEPDND